MTAYTASTATAVVLQVLLVLSQLLSVPLLISYLGAKGYSDWLTVSSLAANLQVLALGLHSAALAMLFNGQAPSVRNIASRVIGWHLLLAVFGSVVLLIGVSMSLPGVKDRDFADLAIVLGVASVVQLPGLVSSAVWAFRRKQYIENVSSIVGQLLLFVTVLLAGCFRMTAIGLGWMQLAVQSVMTGGKLWFLGSQERVLEPKSMTPRLDPTTLTLIKLGSAYLVLSALSLAQWSWDYVLLKGLGHPDDVIRYSLVTKFITLATSVVGALTAVTIPFLARSFIPQRNPTGERQLDLLLNCALLFAVFVSLVLVTFGQDLVRLWTRLQIVGFEDASVIFGLFLITELFTILSNNVLMTIYSDRRVVIGMVLSVTAKLGATVALVGYLGWIGLAIACALGSIVGCAFSLWLQRTRSQDLPNRFLYRNRLVIVFSYAVLLCCWLLKKIAAPAAVTEVVVTGLLTVITVAGLWSAIRLQRSIRDHDNR